MENEREQTAAAYQDLVREIAEILGWTRDQPREECAHFGANISLPTGERLNFYRIKGRIEIRGQFAHGYSPYNSLHKITVSCDREAKSIAGAIKGRLLTAYLPAYRAAADREAAYKAERAKAEALASEMAGMCGGEVSRNDADRFHLYGEHLHIEGQVHEGLCSLNISGLPAELATKVLRVIRESEVKE